MNTRTDLNIDVFFDNIINSYETRIQKIQTAFQSSENITESSHSLFDNIHNSLSDLKLERDIINSRLCDNLAKNDSLRKKDYNTMMSGILGVLDEKEKEAEDQFIIYMESQKKIAQELKENMLGINDISSQDSSKKICNVKKQLPIISKQQEMRKEMVIKKFTDFQKLHTKIMECLENLLKKGDQILIQDIKDVKKLIIKEIN